MEFIALHRELSCARINDDHDDGGHVRDDHAREQRDRGDHGRDDEHHGNACCLQILLQSK